MATRKIDHSSGRFNKIVRGRIRKDLKNLITRGELIGKKGKDLVSIPLPRIAIPKIIYGKNRRLVGQGDGEVGDPVGFDSDGDAGKGKAGNAPGEHILEVEISIEELAKIMGEEMKLPRIDPKGKKNITTQKERYTSIRNVGPEAMIRRKKTYQEALKMAIASDPQSGEGEFDPAEKEIVMVRPAKKYRSWKTYQEKEGNAAVILMMDVSGSMGDKQVEIVRIMGFWIDTWLSSQYKGVEICYIIHDAAAREVDKDHFFHTRVEGGTKISSAYFLCDKKIDGVYPPQEWNVYAFHFSDGDNWSDGDTEDCLKILRERLLAKCNLFAYAQVQSDYGSGEFIKTLRENFRDNEVLVTTELNDKDDIYESIKDIFGEKSKGGQK